MIWQISRFDEMVELLQRSVEAYETHRDSEWTTKTEMLMADIIRDCHSMLEIADEDTCTNVQFYEDDGSRALKDAATRERTET